MVQRRQVWEKDSELGLGWMQEENKAGLSWMQEEEIQSQGEHDAGEGR